MAQQYVQLQVLSALASGWIDNCCLVAALALVTTDHLRTFTRERNLIWHRKFNSVTLLFYVNRWVTLAWVITQLLEELLDLSVLPSCIALDDVGPVLGILWDVMYTAFSAIRMYAISRGSWLFVLVLCSLNLVRIAGEVYQQLGSVWYQIETVPGLGTQCYSGYKLSLSHYLRLSSIMMTHFLLNLRQLAHDPQDDMIGSRPSFVLTIDDEQTEGRHSLKFASFVGNIGEFLDDADSDVIMDPEMHWEDDSGSDAIAEGDAIVKPSSVPVNSPRNSMLIIFTNNADVRDPEVDLEWAPQLHGPGAQQA
ncbi:hypothetical protein OBBRIDRAFT_780678 [Obba rivulosa]|uniref:DUF6533 domain-containing protein n=1 Tax=Obba rivulosa TaxID=1052685 RepID=A0A8E2ANR8_9APHY|nr:hypothetical protein OBBRIDRAFT_780678 [Obba rivulosa]